MGRLGPRLMVRHELEDFSGFLGFPKYSDKTSRRLKGSVARRDSKNCAGVSTTGVEGSSG